MAKVAITFRSQRAAFSLEVAELSGIKATALASIGTGDIVHKGFYVSDGRLLL